MQQDDSDDSETYVVTVNHEGQYSIWPAGKALPAGWRPDGKPASRTECLARIRDVWTDQRPASRREAGR